MRKFVRRILMKFQFTSRLTWRRDVFLSVGIVLISFNGPNDALVNPFTFLFGAQLAAEQNIFTFIETTPVSNSLRSFKRPPFVSLWLGILLFFKKNANETPSHVTSHGQSAKSCGYLFCFWNVENWMKLNFNFWNIFRQKTVWCHRTREKRPTCWWRWQRLLAARNATPQTLASTRPIRTTEWSTSAPPSEQPSKLWQKLEKKKRKEFFLEISPKWKNWRRSHQLHPPPANRRFITWPRGDQSASAAFSHVTRPGPISVQVSRDRTKSSTVCRIFLSFSLKKKMSGGASHVTTTTEAAEWADASGADASGADASGADAASCCRRRRRRKLVISLCSYLSSSRFLRFVFSLCAV